MMDDLSSRQDNTDDPHARQLEAYFALMESASLLQHRIDQHLRNEGDLSQVQFQILMRLASTGGTQSMTQLADAIVHSRSGLTYQAGLLEKFGLIARTQSPDDERLTLVTITEHGRARIDRILPGHIAIVRRNFFEALPEKDLDTLRTILMRVRDHMRSQPPRSAAPRARRAANP